MKLYIKEAFEAESFEEGIKILFQGFGGMIKGPTVFFKELFDYLRKSLGIDGDY